MLKVSGLSTQQIWGIVRKRKLETEMNATLFEKCPHGDTDDLYYFVSDRKIEVDALKNLIDQYSILPPKLKRQDQGTSRAENLTNDTASKNSLSPLFLELALTPMPPPIAPPSLHTPPPVFKNMTAEDLKTAAEIFIYMNTCPMKNWFGPWYLLYNNLFKMKSPDIIIATLNRLMKSKNKEFFNNNKKLLKRAKTLFSLQNLNTKG